MVTCLHCHATTTNGLALCDLCQRYAATCLDTLPTYFRNLSRSRRPGRPNGSIGAGGFGDGGSASVIAALGRAENDLSTWARTLADDRDIALPEADTEVELFSALCVMFGTMLTTVATLEWAGEFVRDIARHERSLRAVTEASMPGWYAGTCRQITGRDMEGNTYTCDQPTHVIPGLTWVTCTSCGATTYARDHLDVVLHEARGWVAPPKRLAEALVALLDSEQSVPRLHKRISKWGERDQIETVRRTPYEPKRHRLGDVLDRLAVEGQTRGDRTTEPTSSATAG